MCNRRLSLGRREDPPAELPRDRRAAHGTEQRSERSGLLSRHAFKARGARDVLRDRNHPCGYVINCGAREGINSGIVPVTPPPSSLPPSLEVGSGWILVHCVDTRACRLEHGARGSEPALSHILIVFCFVKFLLESFYESYAPSLPLVFFTLFPLTLTSAPSRFMPLYRLCTAHNLLLSARTDTLCSFKALPFLLYFAER